MPTMTAPDVQSHVTVQKWAHYVPPWADVSIIGIAGSSGSGKSTLAQAIIKKLNLPWVVILSMDSFYKSLTPEQSELAFKNEYDFDSPGAIDFDILVDRLRDLKAGKRAEIPIYSFSKHARLPEVTSIYSPHVLVLEGIFALHDQRVLDLLDMKVYCEADSDTCLARRLLRDVRDRARDIDGCIKQWFAYVKPNFEKYVEPQRKVADVIIPRGIENQVAITMVVQYIEQKLNTKSVNHRAALDHLEATAQSEPLSERVNVLVKTPQLTSMYTILHNAETSPEDFIFYFDRLAALLIEQSMNNLKFEPCLIETPIGHHYRGLAAAGEVSAVIVLRGGAAFETALRRIIPDCKAGRLLIQSNSSTAEPELHYLQLPSGIEQHERVLLMDSQMSSGGSALMAVQVLVDHGVAQNKIVFVTYTACKAGLHRLTTVFPDIVVVMCEMLPEVEPRWVENRYFRC